MFPFFLDVFVNFQFFAKKNPLPKIQKRIQISLFSHLPSAFSWAGISTTPCQAGC